MRTQGQDRPDPEQEKGIYAPVGARLLIEAGPGCGKTFVACARVAHLIDSGEPPDAILLLSFTRTAVHEMRDRITRMSQGHASAVGGVEIRTLDSLAWRITAGETERGSILSYEDNILAALAALERLQSQSNQELRIYLNRFAHVLVDEAQDLVGPRALFITELLNALRPDAGWTVFYDPAQAIYGWSSDGADGQPDTRFIDTLDRLRGAVSHHRLSMMHRTGSASILGVLEETRRIVLDAPSGQRLGLIRAQLKKHTPDRVIRPSEVVDLLQELGPDRDASLVLFRRRVDALTATSYLRTAGVPFRLRLGGMPKVAAPWIAVIANTLAVMRHSLASVRRADFETAWSRTCEGRFISRGWNADTAWQTLRRMGASGSLQVDFRQVAHRLSMSVVPDDVFTKELGPGGPIIGTIHGSKGREAKLVVVCVPSEERRCANEVESDEESRVLYVAISRARERLRMLRAEDTSCSYADQRAWRVARTVLQVEIGRDGDVDPIWPICLSDGEDSAEQQLQLQQFDGAIRRVDVDAKTMRDTRRLVLEGGDIMVGALSWSCRGQVWRIVQQQSGRASEPRFIRFLSWIDVTNFALHPDYQPPRGLPFPWSETRLVLAPVVAGLGAITRYW